MRYPLIALVGSFALLVLATWLGHTLQRRAPTPENQRADPAILIGAVLTLLFLIIGFTFSMAISRYDLRKTVEQGEAIAIGNLYSRADLLAPTDAAQVRPLLRKYLDDRIQFYRTSSSNHASEIAADSQRLQTELWSSIRPAIAAIPAPLMGLLVTGLNDVVSAQRGSQAAWLNRIPIAVWVLIGAISAFCCWLIGYRARQTDWLAFMVVPVAVSISFYLIADLDNPIGGTIRVAPLNLARLSESLPAR
jgi:hypothetical protein